VGPLGTKKKEATQAKQVRNIPLSPATFTRGCDARAQSPTPSADSSPSHPPGGPPHQPSPRRTRAHAARDRFTSPTGSRRPPSPPRVLSLPRRPRRWSWAKSWVPAMAGGMTADECRARPNRRRARRSGRNERAAANRRASQRASPHADKDCY